MSEKNRTTKERNNVKKQKKVKPPSPNDLLKMEIASELGLMDKVSATGWRSLTAKESGRIGGIMAKKMREQAALKSKNEAEKNEV